MIIAVDGTAASGKGTLTQHLAQRLKLAHLDTGSLYRSCALMLLRDGLTTHTVTPAAAETAAKALDTSLINTTAIRHDDVSAMASVIASIQSVRSALVKTQQQFAEAKHDNKDGAILDGRDIGTVILPDADYKFFVDADLDIRAERRYKELINQGVSTTKATVEKELALRDERDYNRKHAPLKQADDAIFVDTSAKNVNEMVAFALVAIGQ